MLENGELPPLSLTRGRPDVGYTHKLNSSFVDCLVFARGGAKHRIGEAASVAAKALFAAWCLSALTGCAVVRTTDNAGNETTRLQPLMTDANLRPPADRPQVVQITTLGIMATAKSFDVGVRNEDIIVAPAKCHAVLVVRTENQARTAAKLARVVNRDCVVRRQG
jgi:hypothetical protein